MLGSPIDTESDSTTCFISHLWPVIWSISAEVWALKRCCPTWNLTHRRSTWTAELWFMPQVPSSVCHAPLGLLCASKGLRTWETRGERTDGVCVCVCSHTDWQECLKCCQQLNLQLWWGAVWVSVPWGKMDRAYYRWRILPLRFQC